MRRFRLGGSKDTQEGANRPSKAPWEQPGPAPGIQQESASPPHGDPAPIASQSGGSQSEWVPQQQPGEGTSSGDEADRPAPIEASSGSGGDWFDDGQQGERHDSEGQPRAEEGQGGEPRGEEGQDERGEGRVDERDEHETREQAAGQEEGEEHSSRVSVKEEPAMRPAPPPGADEEEYKWHTYKNYPSGRPDAVEFIDTYKAFGRNKILRGLNMGLPEGMVSMILGPSGTGKSVCIKHMVGLLYPDDGDILVHGESVPNMPDDDLFEMRKKFGLLFQDGALFGSMNVFDNVAFPLRQHTEKGEDEINDIVSSRLSEVGLADAADRLPNELSGGMRKRAGFARALVLEPDIVLFDEPDSGLDPVRTALLGELILEIHRDMMDDFKEKQKEHLPTFAVITHDIMSARRVADYINVLWKGRIVEAGPAEDMLNSDNPFIRQFLAGESQGPLTMD
jgi:phospholipid/cholesterol/gamma-HCH transport system ATP-binding protein